MVTLSQLYCRGKGFKKHQWYQVFVSSLAYLAGVDLICFTVVQILDERRAGRERRREELSRVV